MPQTMTDIINNAFTSYAGAVLQSRALPDVRDCFKPSARQIFYSMYQNKLTHNKPFKKTNNAIGLAMADYYIHGDSSCEGIIMRASQDFAMRYPLVEVEGSNGDAKMTGNWSAPRYTASRLAEIFNHIIEDIDKDTIAEWRDNYDDTKQYPAVLPSKGYYNIVNGTLGIGVGAASSIPQFNIKEVNEALTKLLWNPDIDFEEIYCAPDFATGATLLNESQVKESLRVGTGAACKLRSTIEWDPKDNCFVVTEIPYNVYTSTIREELNSIIESEDNPGVERYNDLTGEKVLLKIYLVKKSNPTKVLKYLYKNTSLQSHYGINMTMLRDGRYPQVFGWKAALEEHLKHEKLVYRAGFLYDLHEIESRIHILEGLLICLASIDEVVKTIKNSATTQAAKAALIQNFLLDEIQAKAVLDLKLARLAHLEVEKIEKEKSELEKKRDEIKAILENKDLFYKEIEKGFQKISKLLGDARRTKIMDITTSEDEVIEKKQLSLSFTNKGAVFVSETSSLFSQRRNGVGQKFKLDKDEYIVDNLVGENTDTILFFNSKGNYYHTKLGVFSIGEKQYLSAYGLTDNITSAVILSKQNENKFIVFITKKGLIKKSKLSEYNLKRNCGAQAIKLDSDDEIISILFIDDEKLGIMTHTGQFIIVATALIKPIGRLTRGIIGIKLNTNDYVVCARAIPVLTTHIFSISTDGYGKNTLISEFNVTNTNTKGTKIQKSDSMCDFIPITNASDILINSNTTQIRIKYTDIPSSLRGAQGTKLIKLTNNYVVGISSL